MAVLRAKLLVLLTMVAMLVPPPVCAVGEPCRIILPEQGAVCVRHPSELTRYPIPNTPPPSTVANPRFDAPPLNLTLDEAIRIALRNSEVVRVLAGVTAVNSGSTIYDAAIANNGIDQERARFDPNLIVNNGWDRFEPPSAFLDDSVMPPATVFGGTRTDDYQLDFELSKTALLGGSVAMRVDDDTARFRPGVFALNPSNSSSLALSATQPLLQGGGRAANVAPIVLARIETERSFFQLKNSVQDLVRGVIQAYWNLVFARTDLWAREQQFDQLQFALNQAEGQERAEQISELDVAQPRVSLANSQAAVIVTKSTVLQQEAALRSILGWPPYGPYRIVPVTPPSSEELQLDWNLLLEFTEQYRPDIIELKLVLEADQQQLLIARNQALPRLDAVGIYRWNGLEGTVPSGAHASTSFDRSTEWTMGINFSVPIGLRFERAALRQRQLLIARDRANLDQGLLTATHTLAASLRNLEQFYQQYEVFRDARPAASLNVQGQLRTYALGLNQYINALQAITDWGNFVSAEAQALTQFNIEQANLQFETGTILETHGVRFWEERYGSAGPLSCVGPDLYYPRANHPSENSPLYPAGDRPAEEFFNLEVPAVKGSRDPNLRFQDIPTLPPPEQTPAQPRLILPESTDVPGE